MNKKTLREYLKKRNFKKTPEPFANRKKETCKNLYVIQEHHASHLHYDFRLELQGVLKSWAVPKGPSLDPKIKRLAVHVEDHPLSYGSFEGTIPAHQYGAGTVIIWDTGRWEIEQGDARKAYLDGNMTFRLYGKKLRGLWKLIRIKNDPKHWLLVKVNDSDATKKNIIPITKIKKSPMPKLIAPQLATLVDEPPPGNDWLHEIKLDGYRLICFINKNNIRLMTRNQQDWTKKLPCLVKRLKQLKLSNVILDGELVALDEQQHSNFQLLQNSLHDKNDKELAYYVFDLLYHNGKDLLQMPLLQRKSLLQKIMPVNDFHLRYSDHVIGNGDKVYKNACKLSLEGIVSKHMESIYIQKRSKQWLKTKCIKRQEFVVVGYTRPQGHRSYFGSLLLGVYSADKQLQYCGHVGTGFTEASLQHLYRLLQKYQTTMMPFAKKPPAMKHVTWVKPKLMVEVEFSEWTNDGLLRHPSFKGLRTDKSPQEISKETAQAIHTHSYRFSHPDKILFAKQKLTKLDIANYYETIQKWILPHIVNRPLSLVRCPQGGEKKCFFQRHFIQHPIDHLYPIHLNQEDEPYGYIKDIDGLMALVQLGVLEIHPWNCHIKDMTRPDVIIFDLDPSPDVAWKKVIQAAQLLRKHLEEINLKSFVKTTGGKGLHVVVPIAPKKTWDEVKFFAKTFVEVIVTENPSEFIANMSKAKRVGKIFIDYLRNQSGATSIAPYSTRAKENAPVAVPLSWDELSIKIKSDTFTVKNLHKRLIDLKENPWEDFFAIQQGIPE